MAIVTRTHPAAVDITNIEYFIGKDCTMFELDFGAAVNTKTGPTSTIAAAIQVIADHAEILIKGDLHSTNQVMTFLIAHGNETDTYDGSNSETFIVHLEDLIQALGTVDSINMAGSSLTVKTSFNLV